MVIEIDVAYMLLRFPHLTETFVAEEIRGHRRSGVGVRMFSLLAPREELVDPALSEFHRKYAASPTYPNHRCGGHKLCQPCQIQLDTSRYCATCSLNRHKAPCAGELVGQIL